MYPRLQYYEGLQGDLQGTLPIPRLSLEAHIASQFWDRKFVGLGLGGSSTVTGGVSSFNTRTGAVTLSSSDVTTALGYTPGTGNALTQAVSQTSHGFTAGQVVRVSGSDTYALAKGDSTTNALFAGIVSAVADANDFTLLMEGYCNVFSGLTAGTWYYLDPTTAGALTSTAPSTVGQVAKPVVYAISTTEGIVHQLAGVEVTAASTAQYRQQLTGNLSLYVNTSTGSDSNNGTSSGTAFATIQHACNVAAAYDTNSYTITINVASGTYAENVVLPQEVGGGMIVIDGGNSSGGNATAIAPSSGFCVYGSNCGNWTVQNIAFTVPTSGIGIGSYDSSVITIGNTTFQSTGSPTVGIACQRHASILFNAGYTITHGSVQHWNVADCATMILTQSITITLTGTPNFSQVFFTAGTGGIARAIAGASFTFSGAATGTRYNVNTNGVGESLGTLPGNAAGSTSSGGQYL